MYRVFIRYNYLTKVIISFAYVGSKQLALKQMQFLHGFLCELLACLKFQFKFTMQNLYSHLADTLFEEGN